MNIAPISKGLSKLAIFAYGHLPLWEENLSFDNNYIS
jgi:hypothetical protein